MSEFYDILMKVLSTRQMSISSIARELKKKGYDQHRLILTGYLRALHDAGHLEEIDIPPSKVYVLGNRVNRDIYGILRKHLEQIDIHERLEPAVFILSTLFNRPIFKYELELLGIEAQKTENIREAKWDSLKADRSDITRIKIPPDDPAFEINSDNINMQLIGNKVLIAIINDLLELDGLRAKPQKTTNK